MPGHGALLELRWPPEARSLSSVSDGLIADALAADAHHPLSSSPVSSSASASSPPSAASPSAATIDLTSLPSPPPERALHSAKLAALHARLSLPRKVPIQSLARALVDKSADAHPLFNNTSLAELGNNMMAYYGSEHIVCHFPRLPLAVVFAALYGYVGPKALSALVNEWGVEAAAEPGGEVDPGLLQLRRIPHGELQQEPITLSDTQSSNATRWEYRRSLTSRVVYDDEFGDPISDSLTTLLEAKTKAKAKKKAEAEAKKNRSWVAEEARSGDEGEEQASSDWPEPPPASPKGSTLERAQTNFARAVVGAIYLHCGRSAARAFITAHVLSRHLSFSALFDFRQPTRDLSRLCAREGFAGPIARLVSETGRASRHPVFVVGVYSGEDKLGEGAGSSLDEARTRAAVAALKSWYLYSPLDVHLPSEMEEGGDLARRWKPGLIDGGEIIV
ncbi:MAG: hypothetical protein M1826_001068 [Phylliscum demangeonii]|nr:MAG: hypothetical protein M1826_001068 [Phylliscum demangeonii]